MLTVHAHSFDCSLPPLSRLPPPSFSHIGVPFPHDTAWPVASAERRRGGAGRGRRSSRRPGRGCGSFVAGVRRNGRCQSVGAHGGRQSMAGRGRWPGRGGWAGPGRDSSGRRHPRWQRRWQCGGQGEAAPREARLGLRWRRCGAESSCSDRRFEMPAQRSSGPDSGPPTPGPKVAKSPAAR